MACHPIRKLFLGQVFVPFLCALILCGLPVVSHAIEQRNLTQQAGTTTILSASENNYPPYCFVTLDGRADGFSVELLRAALQAMGNDVSFNLGPWSEIKQSLIDGDVQVLPLVGRTPEREEIFDFTFPYLTMHGTIVVRKDDPRIKSLADLAGKQVAVMRGDNAEEFMRRINLGATIVAIGSSDQALQELSEGKHDAVVIQKLVALQLIQWAGLNNLRTVGPPLKEFQQSFCFAVREGDKTLLEMLNEGLSILIADGTFKQLHSKWFAPIEAKESIHRRIIVGGDSEFPPYEFLDKNGEPAGYNVELTRAIARQLGLEVAFRLGPWRQIRSALARDEIDLVQGLFFSPEREKEFDFSPAHTIVSHAIVVRTGTKMPKDLSKLGGKSILVMQGDIMHDVALEFGYAEQVIPIASQEEVLHRLASGEADCALVAKGPALYWINKNGWDNLEVSDSSVRSPEYCYGFPKNKNHLAAIFSEGLANVKATGEYRRIYSKWLGVYDIEELSFEKAVKFTLWVVTPIFLLLLGSIIWSGTLRRTVRKRTLELRQEITERKAREIEIQEKNAELDQKNAELERFTYTVSHDLKSPLVTLKSFLGFIEKDIDAGDREQIKKDLSFMYGAADKMNRLLHDLLELSRIGRVNVAVEQLPFRTLVDEAVTLVAGSMAESGGDIHIEESSLLLWGDRNRLVEIWQNLIDNAIKYRHPQRQPVIEIGIIQNAEEPSFYVSDNGIGIHPNYHEKIFGIFNQLDPAAEGSGLGLTLVKRIVETNQGRIWVESDGSGNGSRFLFTLPKAICKPEGWTK